MDFPFLLIALLALPVVVAALIIAVSAARRRASSGEPGESTHRLQSDTAAVQDATAAQDAADHPDAGSRDVVPGRERRAAAGRAPTTDEQAAG